MISIDTVSLQDIIKTVGYNIINYRASDIMVPEMFLFEPNRKQSHQKQQSRDQIKSVYTVARQEFLIIV